MISDAVSSSMVAVMHRYLRSVKEEEERERIKEEEREIKREEERDLLWMRENLRGRRHSDTDSHLGASGPQFLHPRFKTETMMQSPSTF